MNGKALVLFLNDWEAQNRTQDFYPLTQLRSRICWICKILFFTRFKSVMSLMSLEGYTVHFGWWRCVISCSRNGDHNDVRAGTCHYVVRRAKDKHERFSVYNFYGSVFPALEDEQKRKEVQTPYKKWKLTRELPWKEGRCPVPFSFLAELQPVSKSCWERLKSKHKALALKLEP